MSAFVDREMHASATLGLGVTYCGIDKALGGVLSTSWTADVTCQRCREAILVEHPSAGYLW
jgi:hypothetical protein